MGVAGRRGKRKRPHPVEEEDEDGDDDAFMEGSGSSGGGERGGREAMVVEGRERYVNGLLKQLIKVSASLYVE